MPERFSSDEVIKVLLRAGFLLRSTRGSHMKLKNASGQTVIVPAGRRVLPVGTFHSVLKQADISLVEFKQLLGRQ